MARINWNAIGERFFEAGVDRGVLFVDGHGGVPWNGLISVSEKPSGGEVTPYYIDGIKYLNDVSSEEFQATIEAYTYPEEFSECEGTAPVKNGLFARHQPKKSFGLAYRTLVGNDVEGVGLGYKIHLVYNAVVSPTVRSNNSISDSLDPFNFSWEIVTKSPTFTGFAPTAHFVIDSREAPAGLLSQIEDILYGTVGAEPRLPPVSEIIFLFEEYESSVFDAGYLDEEYYITFDAGHISVLQSSTIDAGGPDQEPLPPQETELDGGDEETVIIDILDGGSA